MEPNAQPKAVELNAVQKEAKEKLAETAKVLVKVLNQKNMVNEMKNLAARSKEVNTVSFRFLFHPEENATQFKSVNSKATEMANLFAQKFRTQLSRLKSTSSDSLEYYLVANNCKLYMPYRENWDMSQFNAVTIAPDPIDNDNEGNGYIVSLGTKSTQMASALVTDNYAYENPTILLLPDNGEIIADGGRDGSKGNGRGNNDGTNGHTSLNSWSDFQKDTLGYRISVTSFSFSGESIGNFESLFRGALEVWFVFGDASNTKHATYTREFVQVSRAQFKNHSVIYHSFDAISNWSRHEDNLPVYIYEADDNGDKITLKLTASISLKMKIPGIGDLGTTFGPSVEYTHTNKDDDFGFHTFDRDDIIDYYLTKQHHVPLNSYVDANIAITTYKNYNGSL